MPEFVNGLPLHVLVVHAVVVLVPLAALGAVVIAFWPAARQRFGWLVAVLVALGAALAPVAASSGEMLLSRRPPSVVLDAHQRLGEQLVYFVGPLLLAVLALMVAHTAARRAHLHDGEAAAGRVRVAVVVAAVFCVGLAAASAVHVYRVGEAGSRSVWEGVQNLPELR